jgi:hypothetical protein
LIIQISSSVSLSFLQDLVIPPIYSPLKYYYSTLHGAPEQPNRKILAFFKGDLRLDDTRMIYSRGIRQKLASLVAEHTWWSTHTIWIGQKMPIDIKQLTYGEALSSSIFCFVLPGDGWSGRFEDAILHGCIPVIIQDEVDVSFESLFDVSEFSLRIAQKDMEQIPEILNAVSKEEIQKLQQGVAKMMVRYSYLSYEPHAKLSQLIREDWEAELAGRNNSTARATEEEEEDEKTGEKEEEVEKRRRRRLLAKASEKKKADTDSRDERITKSAVEQQESSKDATNAAVDGAAAAPTKAAPMIQDDAFETILAFLTDKMKRWERE